MNCKRPGIGTLLPWNMFISVVAYWDYKFRTVVEDVSIEDANAANATAVVDDKNELQKAWNGHLAERLPDCDPHLRGVHQHQLRHLPRRHPGGCRQVSSRLHGGSLQWSGCWRNLCQWLQCGLLGPGSHGCPERILLLPHLSCVPPDSLAGILLRHQVRVLQALSWRTAAGTRQGKETRGLKTVGEGKHRRFSRHPRQGQPLPCAHTNLPLRSCRLPLLRCHPELLPRHYCQGCVNVAQRFRLGKHLLPASCLFPPVQYWRLSWQIPRWPHPVAKTIKTWQLSHSALCYSQIHLPASVPILQHPQERGLH